MSAIETFARFQAFVEILMEDTRAIVKMDMKRKDDEDREVVKVREQYTLNDCLRGKHLFCFLKISMFY